MATVAAAIADAFSRLGVIAPEETLSSGALAKGFAVLNTLADMWGAERFTIPSIARTTATITASQASYTVGTGGGINIVRPVYPTNISYIDTSQDPDLEIPLRLLTDDEYAAILLKTLTSLLPTSAYYNPTYASGFGTLIPWPIPTSATLQWAFYAAVALAQFAATSTTLAVPPGYYEFIVTNLAARLGVVYGVPSGILTEIKEEARVSKSVIKAANFRMSDLSIPAAAMFGHHRGGYVNFLTGP